MEAVRVGGFFMNVNDIHFRPPQYFRYFGHFHIHTYIHGEVCLFHSIVFSINWKFLLVFFELSEKVLFELFDNFGGLTRFSHTYIHTYIHARYVDEGVIKYRKLRFTNDAMRVWYLYLYLFELYAGLVGEER